MPFPSALTAGQKTDIRADYRGETYMVLNPNTVVFACQVNGTPAGNSFASLTVDSVTVGSISAALDGFRVLISHSNNINAWFFDGRIRAGSSGSTLNINETSAAIVDGDYVFVVKDVPLREKLGRISAGVLLLDYDETFVELPPVVYGLQSGYAVVMDGSGNADLALAPSVLIPTSGNSASTWSWSQVDGASFVAGSSSTQNVTLRWTTAGVKWVRVTHTDSGGLLGWFSFPVAVIPADYSTTVNLGEDDISWTGDLDSGFNGSIRAFNGVSNILDNTLAVVFTARETMDDGTTPIVSNVNFVARLRTETTATSGDDTYSSLEETRYTLDGFLTQLGRIPAPALAMTNNATPTLYGEINNLTVWRAIVFMATGFSTFANVCSLQFDSTDNTYLIPETGSEDTSFADSANDILDSINASLVFAPQGECYIARSAEYLSDAARALLTTVVDFTTDDLLDFAIDRDHQPAVGRIIGYGASWNSTANTLTVIQSVAPAVAPGQGQGRGEVNNQILDANLSQADAETETAARVARNLVLQNPTDELSATLLDGYHWFVPSRHQLCTFTIAASDTTTGKAYTTVDLWLCISVSVSVDNELGIKPTSGTFRLLQQSGDSLVVSTPAPGETVPAITVLPPTAPYSSFTATPGLGLGTNPTRENSPPADEDTYNNTTQPDPPSDDEPSNTQRGGNMVACFNVSGVWKTKNFALTSDPYWIDRRPAASNINDFRLAFGSNKAYVAQWDDPDTNAWRNTDFWGSGSWAAVVLSAAQFTQVRAAASDGIVYVYSPSGNTWQWIFDFETASGSDPFTTYGDGGFTADVSRGHHTPSTGWEADDAAAGVEFQLACYLTELSSYTITSIELLFNYTAGENNFGGSKNTFVGFAVDLATAYSTELATEAPTDGTGRTITWTGTASGKSLLVRSLPGYDASTPPPSPTGSATARKLTLTGTGTPPSFVSGNFATTRYSSNSGAAFAAEVIVGASPGSDGGVDTQKIGADILASADAAIMEATSGGAYSAEADGGSTGTYAQAIYFFGKSVTSYIFATPASVAGESVWKVVGGVKTAITPNDGANDGLAVSESCLWADPTGTRIYALLSFGGTLKVARSTNGGSSWSFSTGFSASALSIDANGYDVNQVIVADGSTIWYSPDGGANWVAKTGPGGSLKGAWFKK